MVMIKPSSKECSHCHGWGNVIISQLQYRDWIEHLVECSKCNGSGKAEEE